jgi:pimeloyl-ACP methyl ester carboxylesterase
MTETATRPPIVLVHGAWGGAWIWRRVLAPLRAAGHEVHAVTLTGAGDRAHLRRRDIGLRDHVADVVAFVEAEELQDVVLVGHSYGGMVITGAADVIVKRTPGRLRRLVYLDAVVPLPGECWSALHSPETVAARTAQAEAHDQSLPPPDPEVFGLAGADRDWLQRRHVPHPFGPYREPLDFDAARWTALPRSFIDCTEPALPTIDGARRRAREQPGWRLHTMATGHFPMVSMPEALAGLLLADAALAS